MTYVRCWHELLNGTFSLNSAHVGLYKIGMYNLRIQVGYFEPYVLDAWIYIITDNGSQLVEKLTLEDKFEIVNPVKL